MGLRAWDIGRSNLDAVDFTINHTREPFIHMINNYKRVSGNPGFITASPVLLLPLPCAPKSRSLPKDDDVPPPEPLSTPH